MNTINLKQPILNRIGEETMVKAPVTKMVEVDGEVHEEQLLEEKKVLLGGMLEHACLKDDGEQDEQAIIERYNLYLKIANKETVDLSDEDILALKKLVCKSYDVFFAGSILNLL